MSGEESQVIISFILLPGKIPWGKWKCFFFACVGQFSVHIQNMMLIYYQG